LTIFRWQLKNDIFYFYFYLLLWSKMNFKFHNMMIWCSRNINVENIQNSLMNKKKEKQHLSEIKSFVTLQMSLMPLFDQFNASLMNKSMYLFYLFPPNSYWPQMWLMLQKLLFQINTVLLNSPFSKESWNKNLNNCLTLIIIINISRASLISEGSCDTEDWSNDDKFSFDHRNKLHFTVDSHRKLII